MDEVAKQVKLILNELQIENADKTRLSDLAQQVLQVRKGSNNASEIDNGPMQAGSNSEAAPVVALKHFDSELADLASKVEARDRILQSLSFHTAESAGASIPDSHARTFEWIFESTGPVSDQTQASSNFVKWLRLDGGSFWVCNQSVYLHI